MPAWLKKYLVDKETAEKEVQVKKEVLLEIQLEVPHKCHNEFIDSGN